MTKNQQKNPPSQNTIILQKLFTVTLFRKSETVFEVYDICHLF